MTVEQGQQRTIFEQIDADHGIGKWLRFHEWYMRQKEQQAVFARQSSIDQLKNYVDQHPQDMLVYKGEVKEMGYDRRFIYACYEGGRFFGTYSDFSPQTPDATPLQVSYKEVEQAKSNIPTTLNLHLLPYKDQAILELGNTADQKLLQAWYSDGLLTYISCIAGPSDELLKAMSVNRSASYMPIKDCEDCHGPYYKETPNGLQKDYLKFFRSQGSWYLGTHKGQTPLSLYQHINNNANIMRLLPNQQDSESNSAWGSDSKSFWFEQFEGRGGIADLKVGFRVPRALPVQAIFSRLDTRKMAQDWTRVGEYIDGAKLTIPSLTGFTI